MTQEKQADGTQPWSGRFSEPVAELVKRFTASVGFDRRLAAFDIDGSLAHAKMLRAIELLGTRVAPLVRATLASEKVAAPLLKNVPAAALKTN